MDATATLSDHLNGAGIAHEIVGLPDAVKAALEAQFEMVCLAAGDGDPVLVRRALGIFVTSIERGRSAPALARMIVGQAPASIALDETTRRPRTRTYRRRIRGLRRWKLSVMFRTLSAWSAGARTWSNAFALLRALVGPRLCRAATVPTVPSISSATSSLASRPNANQLGRRRSGRCPAHGLYQSKGREADATIVVLRGNDYFGQEAEPMPNGSRLLYVVLTKRSAQDRSPHSRLDPAIVDLPDRPSRRRNRRLASGCRESSRQPGTRMLSLLDVAGACGARLERIQRVNFVFKDRQGLSLHERPPAAA